MVYITVGSAANPILEFLEEWGTENFEVCFCFLVSVYMHFHLVTIPSRTLWFCFDISYYNILFYCVLIFFRRYHQLSFHKLLKFLSMVVGLEFIETLTCWLRLLGV
jgi:hypothetical protein